MFSREDYMAALAEIESSGNASARGQMHGGMRAPARGLFQLTPTTAEGLVRNYPSRFSRYKGLHGPQILNHIAGNEEAQREFQDALIEDQVRFLDAKRPGWQDRKDAAHIMAIAHRFGTNQALKEVDGTLRHDHPATSWERETPAQYLGRFDQYYKPSAASIQPDGTISPANRTPYGGPDPRRGLVEHGDTDPGAGWTPQAHGQRMPQRDLGQPDRSGATPMTPEQMKEYMRAMDDPSYIPPPPFGSPLDSGVPGQTQEPGRPASALPSGPSSAPAPALPGRSSMGDLRMLPGDGRGRTPEMSEYMRNHGWIDPPQASGPSPAPGFRRNEGDPQAGVGGASNWMGGPDPRAGLVEHGDTMLAPVRTQADPARILADTQAKDRPYMHDMAYLIDRDSPRYQPSMGDVHRVEGRDSRRDAGPPDIYQDPPNETNYMGLRAKYPDGGLQPELATPEAATLKPDGTIAGAKPQVDPAIAAAIQYHMADPDARAILDEQQRQEVRQRLMSTLSPPAQPKSSGWGNLPMALAAGGAIGGSAPYTRAYEMMSKDEDAKTAERRYADAMRFKESDNLLGVLGADSSSRMAPRDTITMPDGTVVDANDYEAIDRVQERQRKRPMTDEADQLALEQARLVSDWQKGQPARYEEERKRRAAEDERDALIRAADVSERNAYRNDAGKRQTESMMMREREARRRAYDAAMKRINDSEGPALDAADQAARQQRAKAEVDSYYADPTSDSDPAGLDALIAALQPKK